MTSKSNVTFIITLISLILVPLFPYKMYIGFFPLSAEVVLVPCLVIGFFIEWRWKRLTLNSFAILPFVVAFGAYFVVAVLSLYKAEAVRPGVMELFRYGSYVCTFLIVVKVDWSRKQYRMFAAVFAAVSLIVVAYGIFQYMGDVSLNKAGMYALQEAKGRVDSTFQNPNYYSAFLNYVIPTLLLFTVVYWKDRHLQLISFLVYALFVINVVLTYTRAAWLTMAGAFILSALSMPRAFIRNTVRPHLLISFLLLLTAVYNLPDVENRAASAIQAAQKILLPGFQSGQKTTEQKLVDNDETTNKAVMSRLTLWKTGLYMYKENPLLGVGIGNYYARYKEYIEKYPELDIGHEAYSVHNSYLKVAAETGTLGLVSFLGIYSVYFYYVIRQCFRQNTAFGKVLAIGLGIGSFCYMIQNVTNNLIFIPQLNLLFWLIGGLVLGFLYTNKQRNGW